MTVPITADGLAPATRRVRFGRHSFPVILPQLSDPRLHVAVCLLTVQVLGQTVVDWDLSIAQLLLCLGTAFVLEVAIVARRQGVLAWPASALLTANGVALLLRVPGTEHGDWWSTEGAAIFVGTTAFAVASKYLIRVDRRPLFNPSNVALVACFLLLGSTRVDPQDFWWGPWSFGLAVTYAVILVGGLLITARLGLLPVVASFILALGVGLGIVAVTGHAITARWHVGLLTGFDYWRAVVASPETLIFLFFMITDPKTIPLGRSARVAHGAVVGLAAVLLAAPQTTEFATKVAILAALVVGCGLRPLLEHRLPETAGPALGSVPSSLSWRRTTALVVGGVAFTGAVILAGAPSRDLLPDAPTGERPVVAVDAPPTVRIDDSVTDVDLTFPLSDVDALARDLLEDLAIEAEALRSGDPTVAAHGATGDRLAEVEVQIAEAAEDVEVPSYDVDEMVLILHRELEVGQAAPRLGLEAHGTVRRDRAVDGRIERGPIEDHAAVYLMTEVDGRWLIDDVRPA